MASSDSHSCETLAEYAGVAIPSGNGVARPSGNQVASDLSYRGQVDEGTEGPRGEVVTQYSRTEVVSRKNRGL